MRMPWKILIVCMALYQVFLTWHFTVLTGDVHDRLKSGEWAFTDLGIATDARLRLLVVTLTLGVVVIGAFVGDGVLHKLEESDKANPQLPDDKAKATQQTKASAANGR